MNSIRLSGEEVENLMDLPLSIGPACNERLVELAF